MGYDGMGDGVYVFDDVQCNGTESSLFECPHTNPVYSYCDGSYAAGVKCLSGAFEI